MTDGSRQDLLAWADKIEETAARELLPGAQRPEQVLTDRGYEPDSAQTETFGARKQEAYEGAMQYADKLRTRAAAMAETDQDAAALEQAQMVEHTAAMGGWLSDGEARAWDSAREPSRAAWGGREELKDLEKGKHHTQERAKTMLATGNVRRTAAVEGETVAELHLTPDPDYTRSSSWSEEADQEHADAANREYQEAIEEQPTSQPTDDQEEKASGLPQAQDADYSEEPSELSEDESTYEQFGAPWATGEANEQARDDEHGEANPSSWNWESDGRGGWVAEQETSDDSWRFDRSGDLNSVQAVHGQGPESYADEASRATNTSADQNWARDLTTSIDRIREVAEQETSSSDWGSDDGWVDVNRSCQWGRPPKVLGEDDQADPSQAVTASSATVAASNSGAVAE